MKPVAQNILITGGCGFIGVNLVAWLRDNAPSADITVVDNLTTGRKEHLEDLDVAFVEGDIRDAELVSTLTRKAEAIVHLAADTRVLDSIKDPDFNFDVNVVGTYRLLSAARRHDVQHFVMASTGGAIIGGAQPPVHEGMAPRPVSPYGASKLMAEGYLSAFAGAYGMKTVALRFSNVYGPRSYHKGSVVARLCRDLLSNTPFTVYGDGSQTRDYVYVEDLSEAIYRSLSVREGGKVFQLGTGVPTSLSELMDRVESLAGPDYPLQVEYAPFVTGEIRYNYADISKARKELSYEPRVELGEGLARTWAWFKQRPGARRGKNASPPPA